MNTTKTKRNRSPRKGDPDYVPYDTSTLSFGLSGAGPVRVNIIRFIEWFTGKPKLLRIANKFEKSGRVYDTTFWEKILELLDIDMQYSETDVRHIPEKGPVVVVANHPYGFVDGLALTVMVSRVRPDLKILTRAFFATLPEIEDNMVPVAFPHDVDSTMRNIEVRKEVMEHLANDGVVILFPAGRCATSPTAFSEAVEHDWNPFTAKMILKSKARVVPVYFPGQNGWLFQFVQTFSATLRQALMMHEITRLIGKTLHPVIGRPLEREELDPWTMNPRGFMAYLRGWTIALKDKTEDQLINDPFSADTSKKPSKK